MTENEAEQTVKRVFGFQDLESVVDELRADVENVTYRPPSEWVTVDLSDF